MSYDNGIRLVTFCLAAEGPHSTSVHIYQNIGRHITGGVGGPVPAIGSSALTFSHDMAFIERNITEGSYLRTAMEVSHFDNINM